MKHAAAMVAGALLASCAVGQPSGQPASPIAVAPAPAATTARAAGVVAGPPFESLGIGRAAAQRALAAFRLSCPALVRRTDASGLTRSADWEQACEAARGATDPQAFFASALETVRVGTGAAFSTGYYEPEIMGARAALPGYVPVYAKPGDLRELDLGQFRANLAGRSVTGRLTADGFVPYFDRAAIESGALAGRGLEIAWAADPIDFFFLQVQGSGRLRMPDGSVMRIGYAGQNGHDYTAIGRVMRERGLLQPGRTTMQDLVAWLRANPEPGRAIMRENRSWVFFRELTGPGPLGALELPITERVSIAVDPAFVPLGAPVVLSSMDRAEANGLWVAHDTGGAIKGANRFDTFWGAGEEAARIAGGMTARGTALLLLPRGTLARLAADASPQP